MAKNLDNHVRQRDLLIIEPQGQTIPHSLRPLM